MKLKTIIVLSLIGCVWGGFLGHSVIIEKRDKLASDPLFSMFNPQFVKEAETGGFKLVFDQKNLRIGFVVTDTYCEVVESLRQKALSLRKSEKRGDLFEALEIEGGLPKSVPSVGEASFDWTGTGMSQTDQTVLRWTTYASGIVLGATFGFLCHLLVLLSIKAVTFGIRRSCNKVQLYLCAVFIPLIPGLPVFWVLWGEGVETDEDFYVMLLWSILTFLFEFMLFSSSGPAKAKRSKDRLPENVELSATAEAVERYEAEMLPHPPGVKPPEHYGYIHYKAYSYLKKGPVAYRRQDAFGMPPENTPLSILSVMEQGCRQIQEWKGIAPESPLNGLGINGFYRLIELFHFKVVGQSASFGDDGTVMDKMTIRHTVLDWELTLYNMVNRDSDSSIVGVALPEAGGR